MLFFAAIIASGNQENGQGSSVTCMDMFNECAGGRGVTKRNVFITLYLGLINSLRPQ